MIIAWASPFKGQRRVKRTRRGVKDGDAKCDVEALKGRR